MTESKKGSQPLFTMTTPLRKAAAIVVKRNQVNLSSDFSTSNEIVLMTATSEHLTIDSEISYSL